MILYNVFTRGIKLTTAIMLVISFIFSGPGPITGREVAVFAVTQPDELNYNAGHRDTVCTELSAQAMQYYTGEFTDDKLSKLEGDDLYAELNRLMTATVTGNVSYKMLTKYFPYTDAEDGTAGTVLFYCDELPGEKTIISREHVWPKAHASFHESKGGADLHHLRPTDSIVNSKRGSYIIGTVDKEDSGTKEIRYGDKNTGKISGWWNESANRFEPLDNVKGDMARILLYVYVRWEEPNLFADDAGKQDPDDKQNDGVKVIESLDTLLKWIEEDPVDTWEMGRNDLVETVQGNRNVFIDHPEYAWALFGKTAPESVKLSEPEPVTDNIPKVTVSKKTLKAVGGKSYKIRFENLDGTETVKYKSSNTKVAKVTKKGKIVPVAAGNASITVTIKRNGEKYKYVIEVKVK